MFKCPRVSLVANLNATVMIYTLLPVVMRAKGACGTTTDVVAFLRVRVIAAFQPEVSEDISLERVEFVSTPVRY